MRLTSDPVYGEVDITATAKELEYLARVIAEGAGFISAAPTSPPLGHALTGIEVRNAPAPASTSPSRTRRRPW